jgi:putative membrane protein
MAKLHAVHIAGERKDGRSARARRSREPIVLLVLLIAALVFSGLHPKDRRTWLLETAPILVGVPILILTYKEFPWTPLAYRLAFGLSLLLAIGGHYHYAQVPIGLWVKEHFDLRRNDYDRLVHFFGGFVPAILGRELLLRRSRLRNRFWISFLVAWSCLAGAAAYELLEWLAASIEGTKARDFLATQGDRWDTQWDMLTTFVGAIASLLILSRLHDRQLVKLGASPPSPAA